MKLRQLFEGMGQEVAIIFGRFNPPHKGHRAAWELASKSPIWYVGTNESTVGPKDPLPYGVKVEAMTAIWPEVEGHIIAETSWLTLASLVYEKHGDITLLCLTDEDWVTKTIVQYNGKEGAHGFYNFKQIKQKPTPRLSSATALRDAVTKGDREAFAVAAGVPANTPVAGKPFFDLVAEYLLPYSNAPVKKVAKKKATIPAESIVREFAPDDGEGGEEDTLLKFARMWYNGDEATQQKVEQALARQGWEIGELESEEGGAFVIRAGDENGDSYIGFAVADLEEDVTEATLGSVLEWPEVANKVNSAMKAMGWKGQRKGDDAFMFSTKGQETDDQFYFVIIENEGNGMFHYALGTVEDGDPHIDDAYKGNLPNTEASISELMNDIREGFGLGESASNAIDTTVKRLTDPNDGKVAKLRAAGDKRREEHLKGRDIAKRDSTSKDEWGNMKKEDAAGVGIITKQNSTVDVNKGTPRKNLKAFRLVK